MANVDELEVSTPAKRPAKRLKGLGDTIKHVREKSQKDFDLREENYD